MADKGSRSVEVNVQNMTLANLTIQNVTLTGSGTQWIKNETPVQGAPVNQYNTVLWGAENEDYNTSAGGSIVLTGYGDPLIITFQNDEKGNSTCTAPPTNEISTMISPVDTGELNHSQFNVKLR